MADAVFDPTHAVRFDLAKGVVLASSDERLVVVGVAALEVLARAAEPRVLAEVGRSVGGSIGQRIADRFGGPSGVRAASLEAVVSHLGGELAVGGFGHASVERWGRAMVVVLERPALTSDPFLASIVAGALAAATGVALTCEPLGRERGAVRFLVAREATARRARAWLASGVPWSDVVARLHGLAGASP